MGIRSPRSKSSCIVMKQWKQPCRLTADPIGFWSQVCHGTLLIASISRFAKNGFRRYATQPASNAS